MVSTEFAEGPGGIRLTSRRGSWKRQELWGSGAVQNPPPAQSDQPTPTCRVLLVGQASGGCSVPRGRPIAGLALALPHPDAGLPRRAAPAELRAERTEAEWPRAAGLRGPQRSRGTRVVCLGSGGVAGEAWQLACVPGAEDSAAAEAGPLQRDVTVRASQPPPSAELARRAPLQPGWDARHVIETPEPGEWELSGYEAAVPITEKSNPLTRNLDKADAEKIVQLLGQCDADIFQEEGQIVPTYQRLYSESVLTTMLQVAGKVQEVLKEPDGGLVVLSGGGTSGCMAFLMSVSFNHLMKGLGQKPLYTYLIAGGNRLLLPTWPCRYLRSIVASQERTEDSALHWIDELKKVAAGKKRVIVIGISVGLSAPFVAGQMDYCTDNTAVFLPVLVGFNPVSMARNDPIEDWRSTFRQVAERMQKMQEKQEAFALNPAIEPEGLSGSSLMKGGSTTKILLETLLLAAHRTVDQGVVASQRCLLDILRTFERAHQVTYSQSSKVATLMKQVSTRCMTVCLQR
ncbi:glucokinase regulatory protein-like, partial [Alexandromys fortis]|uniref:glucokinase regulatory protein-like n=1 Tax=Alexandromys fortis TaxID=100897 RepID=UPI0021523DEF